MFFVFQTMLALLAAMAAQEPARDRPDGGLIAPRANPHGTLSVACENCHTAEGWRPLRNPVLFHHDKQTGFPLRQGHRNVDCAGCHRDLRFAHVATACADCHSDPHRGEMGLACDQCHTTAGWDDRKHLAKMHASARFPLTGAHLSVECSSCHRDAPNRYFGASTRCIACHEDDYRRAIPNHPASGFSTECQICHSTSSFQGAGFPGHDQFFPISSGPHAGVWSSCAECHPSTASFRIFTCLSCHEHNREDMDDEHDDVRNYRYDSNACLSCHPAGRR